MLFGRSHLPVFPHVYVTLRPVCLFQSLLVCAKAFLQMNDYHRLYHYKYTTLQKCSVKVSYANIPVYIRHIRLTPEAGLVRDPRNRVSQRPQKQGYQFETDDIRWIQDTSQCR